jgi:hypothetical protein
MATFLTEDRFRKPGLITVLVGLKRTRRLDTDVLGLLVSELCEPHPEGLEMESSHLFIEMLG